MKLYYSAGSCSTSCHISLEEAGLKYEAIEVDWDNPSDPNLKLIEQYNPMGTLPILVLDNGKALNQNMAIHAYVSDQAPAKNLFPKAGTFEHAEAVNWFSFVAADLHKAVGGMFGLSYMTKDPKAQADIREWMITNDKKHFAYLDSHLAGRDYILGKQFSVIDAYCFIVLGWTKWLKIPLDEYKNIQAYMGRVLERPAVQRVLKAEGLVT